MSKKKRKSTEKLRLETKEANKRAHSNLKEIEKPRKAISKSFTAQYETDECATCFVKIEPGQTIRYNPDGFLVHARHPKIEETYDVCTSCFLTRPCMCE